MNADDGRAIGDAFGLGNVDAFVHAADGMMARIWRLDSALGTYAVKEFRAVSDVDDLGSRLEVSTQLADAARAAGVVCPRAIRTSTSSLLLRLNAGGDGDPVYLTVATWIDGRPLNLKRDGSDAVDWLGRVVASIERAPDPQDAHPLDPWLTTWLTTAPSESQWGKASEESERTRKPWSDLLNASIDQLVRLGMTVTPSSDEHQGVLHTDLQPKNVLVTPNGFALLDWDDAARCSRDRILARAPIEWLTPGGMRPGVMERFVDTYRSHGGLGKIDDVTDFGYASAAFLNYLYESVTSDLTSDQDSDDSSREIIAALTNPLTISTFEDVLARLRAMS